MPKFFRRPSFPQHPTPRGQSFVELALVLPVLLIMLLGLVEVAFFMSKYLDGLDLTREAARFASIRDPFASTPHDSDCFSGESFDFYWDTSCIFAPSDKPSCLQVGVDHPGIDIVDVDLGGTRGWLNWCNGLNKYLNFNPATDDVVLSAYTVNADNTISQVHPNLNNTSNEHVTDSGGNTSYYWALSNHLNYAGDTAHRGADTVASPLVDNWKKDCKGTSDPNRIPYYTMASVTAMGANSINASDFPAGMTAATVPGTKGFIAVELYYCHSQVLGLPFFTIFVPNPILIHVYTLMPLPAAAPTPTPNP